METTLLKRTITVGGIGSPVKLISREKVIGDKLLITYGGGMGGSREELFGHVTSVLDSEVRFKKITGEELRINKRFIVTREPIQMFIELWDTTERTNYNGACKKSTHQRILAFTLNNVVGFDDSSYYDGFKVDTYDTIEK